MRAPWAWVGLATVVLVSPVRTTLMPQALLPPSPPMPALEASLVGPPFAVLMEQFIRFAIQEDTKLSSYPGGVMVFENLVFKQKKGDGGPLLGDPNLTYQTNCSGNFFNGSNGQPVGDKNLPKQMQVVIEFTGGPFSGTSTSRIRPSADEALFNQWQTIPMELPSEIVEDPAFASSLAVTSTFTPTGPSGRNIPDNTISQVSCFVFATNSDDR